MAENKKRKSGSGHEGPGAKKSKPWMVPRKGQPGYVAPSIEPGDAGIWATCEMGKEGKCTSELRDLFEEYAGKLYGHTNESNEEPLDKYDDDDPEIDIEAEINKEVKGLKSKSRKKGALFQTVKMDIQCVLFFKTRPPIEPVEFVHRICKDALEGATKKHRWVKRLTPMIMMGRATAEGLDQVATSVLEPVFHSKDVTPQKFAIRPTRRNHNVMKRDEIIRQIARTVGSRHSVDLKNYDHLILVDVYRNVLGMSVVGSDFEELKQFNLSEIYDPTPKPSVGSEHKGQTPMPNISQSNFPLIIKGENDPAPTVSDVTSGDATLSDMKARSKEDSPARSITNHLASVDKEEALSKTPWDKLSS